MNFSAFDEAAMRRALELAERGLYSTHPNPRVGAVLARDGEIVGEGWHEKAGEAHAEPIAVRAAGLVLIPVQPSPLDLWATEATLKMARDERRRSLVALNRVPPRSGLSDRIAADLAKSGAPIASTRIGNRVALAQAMALGLGVIENARMTSAAAEISALAEEIRGALSG